ncbi:AraC family transcriptional regulator [Pseudomonas sp. Irchel 3E20]|uniref:AraC family transcriptional regulator n=1 Tax=Pseudomonas sp. Irchel 3E20 TaxID=2008983 RepID=UPI000BA3FDCD|nr:AraC family transcriptional regulator [Pseudomonas sp. Irchel 3E20]
MPRIRLHNRDQAPRFWRDPALAFIQARGITDGRQACYARHSHAHFSIGAITAGHSTYLHEHQQFRVSAGTVVLMNPGEVHACNPVNDQPWSYRMLYVDTQWLAALQQRLGFSRDGAFQPFAVTHSEDASVYAGLNALYDSLLDEHLSSTQKQDAAHTFFTALHQRLATAQAPLTAQDNHLAQVADYIRAHCQHALKLDDLCALSGLSSSYLIRRFKQRYAMTPHAFLINCRIQRAEEQLRNGHAIAEVALAAGFADQAHFQRAFKQHLAATPGQYRS